MKSPRWDEIDRIFAAALELLPAERSQFVAQQCAGDEELREEVESLLAHDFPASLVGGAAVVEEATRLLKIAEAGALAKKKIGPYEITGSLGSGGMGRVYLAHDNRLNRPVAVKLLSFYDAAEEERVKRFRQEALAASALNHPNILTIYEIGEFDGHNFIVTEFVDGKTLLEQIYEGAMSVAKAIEIAVQIASALSAAHAAGIVHRDIKPANIMVRPDGLVKVLDFGIAKYTQPGTTDQQESALLTTPGAVVGTAAYMSPEQARGYPIDPRTDIWSLGVILYEMATGVRPFQGNTPLDLMSAVIERDPPSIIESGVSVPESFEQIVLKALRKDRDARYQSASEVLVDLRELQKRLEQGVEPERSQPSLQTNYRAHSIAVLPFVNMSTDPENEYFCDGLSEELLNSLTKIDDLRVAARSSAFSFKGKNATVSAIGRALNVGSVLEGSVRKSGNRLRITVQLSNCADGYHLWSERYDREMKDIFDIQDEISLAVVDALKVTLIGKEKAAVLKRYTENVEAYQLYLKGRYYWWKTAPEEFAKGREYFERAVQVDPTYALSYCGVSSYYGFGSAWGMLPPEVGWRRAVAANESALELDDTLAEVYTNLGGINMVNRRDPVEAEKSIRRALDLNPKFQEAHYLYSFFLLTRNRLNEAIAEARLAVELDPLSSRLLNHLGFSYSLASRYEEAVTQYQRALEFDPHNPVLRDHLSDALARSGKFAEAVNEWQWSIDQTGDHSSALELASVYVRDGFDVAARLVAEKKLGQLSAKRERGEYVPEIHFVRALLASNRSEEALGRLERACEERNVFPLLISVDPFYERVRTSPRVTECLTRIGLIADSGVRLLATQDSVRPADTGSSKVATTRIEPKAGRVGSRTLIAGGLLIVVMLAVGFWVYRSYAKRQPPVQSIAVLPFKNESGNSELNYLSDGLTDSLINTLAQLPSLSVKARSSVFRYKDKEVEPQEIARQLSVQAILSGRLVQQGDNLTLYLALVDAREGNQIWGQQYDRKVIDSLSLQKEIARDVSRRLQPQWSAADEKRVAKDYTRNPQAYEYYLKGRMHLFNFTLPGIRKAIEFYQKAIDLDPNYAIAYAGMADAYRVLPIAYNVTPQEVIPKAKAAALKALEIDEALGEAHIVLGWVAFMFDYDWQTAEREFKRAIELSPNNADAHRGYAHMLSNSARHSEALVEGRIARELDPLTLITIAHEGQFLFYAGRDADAFASFQKALELDPNFWIAHNGLGRVYLRRQAYPQAIAEFRKAKELFASAEPMSQLAYAFARSGDRSGAMSMLGELKELQKQESVPIYAFALIHHSLGETDKAFKELERSFQAHEPQLSFIKVDTRWDNIRSDPRFQDLQRRVGL